MLINRWKKDKDKDKEKSNSTTSSTNVNSSTGTGGGIARMNSLDSNCSVLKSSSSVGSNVKKKRKTAKDGADEEWNGESEFKSKMRVDAAAQSEHGSRAEEDVRKNSRSIRREDPRRHTLTGDHRLSAANSSNITTAYPSSNSFGPSFRNAAVVADFQGALPRGYQPNSNSMLFDDDPGIMSEVETSSTGFRRGNKQRSSLPVVRTPSKTLERPLGLVFLQYRNETKRSLLPNEITSLDTVKALFVRSFPKQLSMEYLDSPRVKIYIHDSNKDMFYELEDLKSHLNEIRDRSVLRLFECTDTSDGNLPAGLSVPVQMWSSDSDQSYFSEPEFDSDYQHQHVHKTKASKTNIAHQPYYATHSFPPVSSTMSLPRGGYDSIMRPFSPAIPAPKRAHSSCSTSSLQGFRTSPEKTIGLRSGYSTYGSSRSIYDDTYYSQYNSRPSSITPVIDEEVSDGDLFDDGYATATGPNNLYAGIGNDRVKLPSSLGNSRPGAPYDTRLRVEHMERQLANLTGLVQKALTQTVPTPTSNICGGPDLKDPMAFIVPDSKPPKLSRDKSVSFEKSVSFSDDPPEVNSAKQHSPQHTDSKPTKPAIKSSTLPRTSSQERERLKPCVPPKPSNLTTMQYDSRPTFYRDLQLTPEMYNYLRGLQKKTKDLRHELRSLRRLSLAQLHTVNETIRDTFVRIRSVIVYGGESLLRGGADSDRIKISQEEDIYKQDIIRLEDDLTELESTVEELRNNVINKKTRVNMTDVENMALILSKSSKTVADLKLKFPILQNAVKSVMTLEMDRIMVEEGFLKEEPERLESALRRCKKLTGTLVTLKRLASVQEQRLPDVGSRLTSSVDETSSIAPTVCTMVPTSTSKNDGETGDGFGGSPNLSGIDGERRRSNSGGGGNLAPDVDSLLEELQGTKTSSSKSPNATSSLRRLHSLPNSEASHKPPLPERQYDLSTKRVPPPPPPRTSSKSPLASPTNPIIIAAIAGASDHSNKRRNSGDNHVAARRYNDSKDGCKTNPSTVIDQQPSLSTSSSCESINSQDGAYQQQQANQPRHEQLNVRHRELLKKQKALQEQYSRLQQLHKTNSIMATNGGNDECAQLKKTGSESNILKKSGLAFSAVNAASVTSVSTSLTQLNSSSSKTEKLDNGSIVPTKLTVVRTVSTPLEGSATGKAKVYETDIL